MSNDRQEELSASAQAAASADAAISQLMHGMQQGIHANMDRAQERSRESDRMKAVFSDHLSRLRQASVSLKPPPAAAGPGYPTTPAGDAVLQAWAQTPLQVRRQARQPQPVAAPQGPAVERPTLR